MARDHGVLVCPDREKRGGFVEDEEMIDLKPCPFCGGTDLHLESFSGWGDDVIVCYECLAIFSQQEITCEEDLIEAWNRRAKS